MSPAFLNNIYLQIFFILLSFTFFFFQFQLFILKIIQWRGRGEINNRMIYLVTHEHVQVILIVILEIYKETLYTWNWKDNSKAYGKGKKVRMRENYLESKLGSSPCVRMQRRKFICRSTQAANELRILFSLLYPWASFRKKRKIYIYISNKDLMKIYETIIYIIIRNYYYR